MSKVKTIYYCQSCGNQSAKWLGKCPSCGAWNSFVEEVVTKQSGASVQGGIKISSAVSYQQPRKLEEIEHVAGRRLDTSDAELNRVLGGGLVDGSLVLLGGEPGIGKSTLMLQVAMAVRGKKVLYISGEESGEQIKLRATRLSQNGSDCYILTEVLVENILHQVSQLKPDLLIIDSIQTLYTATIESMAGSISQIRESAGQMLKLAKVTGIPVFLIGHITKDGNIAGPKVLEHMVDVVLQFEGDRHHLFRILRATKNRFGSTAEIGIYEMFGEGLRIVENPSGILLSQNDEDLSGTAVCAIMEGARPLLLELQALVSTAVYGTPQRSSTGFDLRRLNMLLAVLEKRCGFRLGIKDVFLNLTGGLKMEDPGMDLAVICAILSSNADITIPAGSCFAAEVGLTGEIRPVTHIEQRILEAQKLGFKKIFISRHHLKSLNQAKFKIQVAGISRIEELYQSLFT